MGNTLNNSVTLASRFFLSAVFIVSGFGKVGGWSMVAAANNG
jgi:uncharacterized membrane protein YphA (DoxX/SURF4 family)